MSCLLSRSRETFSETQGGNIVVLVVEDTEEDELLTLRALDRSEFPIKAVVAHDGAEAVALLSEGPAVPQLILLDLKLPKVSGMEVLDVVRHRLNAESLPVVCLSSSDMESDIEGCYRLGANAYIQKPMEFEEYLSVVSSAADYWLRRAATVAV